MATYDMFAARAVLEDAMSYLHDAMDCCEELDACGWHEVAEYKQDMIANDIDRAYQAVRLVKGSIDELEIQAAKESEAQVANMLMQMLTKDADARA